MVENTGNKATLDLSSALKSIRANSTLDRTAIANALALACVTVLGKVRKTDDTPIANAMGPDTLVKAMLSEVKGQDDSPIPESFDVAHFALVELAEQTVESLVNEGICSFVGEVSEKTANKASAKGKTANRRGRAAFIRLMAF